MLKQINIVCSINDSYTPWCGVLLTSICVNTQYFIHAFVITKGITLENELSLKQLESIYNIKVDIIVIPKSLFRNADFRIYFGDHVSEETFYRIFIPRTLPLDVHKAIYLDVDMLCIDDISKLWNVNIVGYSAIVSDDLDSYKEEYHTRLQLPTNHRYFCAGMLVINLDYWREHNIVQKCIDFNNKNHSIIKFHDQDILNVVLSDSVGYVSYKWQFQTLLLNKYFVPKTKINEICELYSKGVSIIHYGGLAKPWDSCCYMPYRSEWRKYKAKSLWKGTKLRNNGRLWDRLKCDIKYFLRHLGIMRAGYYRLP